MHRLWILAFSVALGWGDDLPRQASEILSANCTGCHNAKLKVALLDVTSREGMLKGGERGEALVPGDPLKSRLYRVVAHLDQPSMPPGKKLQDWQIEVIKRWISTGAPLEGKVATPDARAAMAKMEERPITAEERNWWAFRPVKKGTPPGVKDGWVRNPVDAFLLAGMQAKGLRPAPPANPRALIRRVYLDLIGLPPTVEEVDAYLNDTSSDAYEKVVDRLLASPHYGERWARHWLDLVRYSDSGGFEYDRDRPNAWRFRDYVVKSFNQDKPYDVFVREQLAADEINAGSPPSSKDTLVALGYLRLGPEANIKTEQTRMDELDDILSTTGQTLLGVTLGCARCHNHKFDPIPQKDYYRMQAVFAPTAHAEIALVDEETVTRNKEENKRIDERIKPLQKERAALEKPYRDQLIAAERAKLPDYVQEALRTPAEKRTEGQKLNVIQVEKTQNFKEADVIASMTAGDKARHKEIGERIKEIEKQRPTALPTAMAVVESGPKPDPSYFLFRGSPDSKGSVMQPGVLTVAARDEVAFPEAPSDGKSSWRRKAFAEWVTSKENPLTPRVMANRIWQHHFGEGIVRTPSNFGKTGEKPSHPELLDWLAAEFMEKNWSIKAMHRLLVTSSAYRMASDDLEANRKIDPDNRYLWRMPRQRLEAEIIRDSILVVTGSLNAKTGGPGIHPYIDPSLWQGSSGRTWKGLPDSDPETWRRSLYVFSKRTIPLPMLEVFDKPDALTCPRRNRSTTAPQALILMNNSFVLLQAKRFAARLEKEAGGDPGAQVDRAFLLAVSRPPAGNERALSVEFLKTHPKDGLVDFCQALLNSNEFVYQP